MHESRGGFEAIDDDAKSWWCAGTRGETDEASRLFSGILRSRRRRRRRRRRRDQEGDQKGGGKKERRGEEEGGGGKAASRKT